MGGLGLAYFQKQSLTLIVEYCLKQSVTICYLNTISNSFPVVNLTILFRQDCSLFVPTLLGECLLEWRSVYLNPASTRRRSSERRVAVGTVEPDSNRSVKQTLLLNLIREYSSFSHLWPFLQESLFHRTIKIVIVVLVG